jgi:hypothetical protein
MLRKACTRLTGTHTPYGVSGTLAAVAVLVTLVVPSPSHAQAIEAVAAKPDLAVSSFAGPRAASANGKFLLSDKTSNRSGAARPSSTIYLLSRDRKRGKGDVRLGARALKALKAKGVSEGTGRVTVPRKTKPGRFYVLACADGAGKVAEANEKNNCRASSKPTTVVAAFKPNPLDVSAVPDTARAARGTITTEGGTLVASGADGTRYTLVVPKDALLSREEITITPLSALQGLPFKAGLSGGVLLEPSGLSFQRAVTVRIEPASPVARKQEATFSFAETGRDFHLYPVRHDAGAIVFQLTHFTGVGVAPASSPEFDAQGNRVPTSREAATQQQLHEAISAAHEAGVAGNDDPVLTKKFMEAAELAAFVWGNEGVLPLATAAATDEKLFDRAVSEYLSWSRQQQLLAGSETEGLTAPLKALNARIVAQLKLGFENAVRKAYEGCLAGDLTRIARIMSLARQEALGLAFEASVPGFQEMLDRCVRFELDYDLQWAADHGNGDTAEDGHVRVQRLPLGVAMTGQKDLEYVSLNYHDKTGTCTFSFSTAPKSPFEVASVEVDLNRSPPRYLLMKVSPGTGEELMTQTCEFSSSTSATHLYSFAFSQVHFGKVFFAESFLVSRWDELGGTPYARTTLSASFTNEIGDTFRGTSKWTLHHVPLRP